MMELPAIIRDTADRSRAIGLDAGDIHFEVVPERLLTALTAYGGLLGRYRHWSFGKAFGRLGLQQTYRLSRMYELVVNTDPAVAYVLDEATPLEQRVVVAHVIGHVDFFRRHHRLSALSASMAREAAELSRRVEALSRRRGRPHAEALLADGMVLMDLIADGVEDWRHPANVLGFVLHESESLEGDEREVLRGLESEARAFRPQVDTKIANEGWATWWHSRVMADAPLSSQDAVDYARLQARLLRVDPRMINPYRLGLALWEAARARDPLWFQRAPRVVSDRDLVDRYLTDDVAEAVGLGGGADEPSARERILRLLGNGGVPRIVVEGVRSSRLLLQHGHDGRDLATDDLPGALAAVARLWGGDGVELVTMDGGRPCRFVWAGGQLTTT